MMTTADRVAYMAEELGKVTALKKVLEILHESDTIDDVKEKVEVYLDATLTMTK